MRVFGCLAYATSINPSHKFASRAKRCVFIGYPHWTKAYKLYDLDTHKLFTSRDVIFHEDSFPYQSLAHQSSTTTTSVLPIPIYDTPLSPSPSQDINNQDTTNPDTPTPPLPNHALHITPEPQLPISSPPPVSAPPLRQSHRHKTPSVLLKDYVCSQKGKHVICARHPSGVGHAQGSGSDSKAKFGSGPVSSIVTKHVSSSQQVADILTKPLGKKDFQQCCASWEFLTSTLQLEGEC
ncbi:hypothetical protein L3X38_027120 [Prunus dulcis]|uniref:Retroviral polymerase SH3-like domain-containing protein n=1 Tax=Prunus dulcis TaxID=3755 RepID=A0AAD4VNU2_PRUDU|nr:hypothetical protein L3X38_027120 [Prunus dulcis]